MVGKQCHTNVKGPCWRRPQGHLCITKTFEARVCAHVTDGGIWRVEEVGDDHGQETGLKRQETGDRTQETGLRTQETGFRTQEIGLKTQETGNMTQESGLKRQ